RKYLCHKNKYGEIQNPTKSPPSILVVLHPWRYKGLGFLWSCMSTSKANPWNIVFLDFFTDLPLVQSYITILIVMDLFTKLVHFIPCKGLLMAPK
ncbi:hypothetical protein E2320_017776, partial [Naja naja]